MKRKERIEFKRQWPVLRHYIHGHALHGEDISMNTPTKVLLVEDNAIIAMSFRMDLTQAGYDVLETLGTGEDAVEFVKNRRPDVIVMDIGLPGRMDGIEAAHQIRGADDIPIIFTTGYGEDVMMDRIRNINKTAVLLKPVSVADIQDAVESF